MSRPILYSANRSPPCRGVFLTAAAIGLELEIRETSLQTKDNMTPEYIKMNPQHTIPTLDDNGFILCDSHAIMVYLVQKYAKNDSLYPKDLQTRSIIDQFLHFETGYLFGTMRALARPMYLSGKYCVTDEKIDMLNNAYEIFEKYLEGKKWLVGDSYTLADISCVSTLSSLIFIRPLDKYPNMRAWLKTCEQNLPSYAEKNAPGNQLVEQFFTNILPHSL
ncbi:glutathione S-transferase 1-like [Leptopilina boulardi]|uniref:glutathione S-transferase 1-like n=1 Tax=Leptopilina boulardi TaxID=63433 RepID=UPI0021F51D4E|nr:glutathione S-transferase 1-like [Leptopilina boulardi]